MRNGVQIFSVKILYLLFLLLISSYTLYSQISDSSKTYDLFEMSLDDLMNIDIVSATGQNQSINDAPSIISVITSKQIQKKAYRSVAEAVNSIAGIDIITDHYMPNLGIRGVNSGVRTYSRLIKVMVDGQNVSFRSNSDNILSQSLIPIEAVDKIEVIRGPNSAVYGKNAFLGVINIITKSATQEVHASISQSFGIMQNNPTFGTNTNISGTLNNFSYILSSSYSIIDKSGLIPINVPGKDIYSKNDKTALMESHPLSVFGKVRYSSDNTGTITFDFLYSEINSYNEFADWGTLTHNNHLCFQNSFERLSYKKVVNDKFQTSYSIAHSNGKPLDREKIENDSDPSERIKRKVKYTSIDATAKVSYYFDDISNVSFGSDYNLDNYQHQQYYTINNLGEESLNPGGSNGKSKFNDIGLFLQMIINPSSFFNISFLKDLTITAGYRFDYHNIYQDVFNYRLAAVYSINKNINTKFMYGTSFNAPSSAQLYTNYITPGGVVGNPELKPERAETYEWALNGKLNDNLFFNTNIFYTEISDKIEYLLPYGEVSNITADNVSQINSAGLETEFKLQFDNFSSYINYSFQKSIVEKTNPILGKIKTKTALYPNHIIKFGEDYKCSFIRMLISLEGKIIGYRLASEQNSFIYDPINYVTNRYKLDPYVKFDLILSS
ncbi:MAG: TonB-dependent receptor [Bacteroidales bacterium]|jgi:outer membrane receptor for ferrienterochelin and colicins|nr:TonB-dependent receptor [Bacteroidales bacterium]